MLNGNFLNFIIPVLIITISNQITNGESSDLKKSFIATFPSSVILGGTAKFCIRFQNLDSDVTFNLTDDEPNIFESLEKTISKNEKETCIDINIKENVTINYQKKLIINGWSKDGTYNFNDTKSFNTKTKKSFSLIETDKPVYKPGQRVRIRIVSLDYQLRPVSKVFNEIYIEDSSNSRVNQWNNVESKNGLVDLDMLLSDEPNLGEWKIKVNEMNNFDSELSVVFEVKKYVLPKFEVILDHLKNVKINENSINVSVCAKYSYGKNVRGKYLIKAFTNIYSFQERKDIVFKSVELNKENAKDCTDFQFSLQDLGIPGPNFFQRVNFEASVIESDTNIMMNTSSFLSISFSSMDIEKLEPEYYKPGFPINFKIKLLSVNANPISNQKVSVKLEKESKIFFEKDFFSNENGIVQFGFEPENFKSDLYFKNQKHILLKVKPYLENVTEDVPYYAHLSNPERVYHINSWISSQNSYLQIYKQNDEQEKKETCGEELSFKLKIRSPIELDTNNNDLYFQLQSRSSVLAAGHFNFKSTQTVLTSGETDSLIQINSLDKKKTKISRIDSNKIESNENCNQKSVTKIPEEKNTEFVVFKETEKKLQPKTWIYNSVTNECISSEEIFSYFYSKEACEESCKINPFVYNSAGDLFATSFSTVEYFYDYTYELKFKVTDEMSPEVKLLAFYIINDEIIPDHTSIKLKKCLKNKVDLQLDSNSVQVGKKIELTIKSQFNSLCALAGIDKSVTFMGKRNSIEFEKVFEKLSDFDLVYDYSNEYAYSISCNNDYNHYPYPYPYPRPRPRPVIDEPIPIERRKRSFFNPYSTLNYDASKSFRESRVIYLSDLKIYKNCRRMFQPYYFAAMPRSSLAKSQNGPIEYNLLGSMREEPDAMPTMVMASEQTRVIQTIRTFFPETWLWDIRETDDDGLIKRKEKVPDSITDWNLDAYCLSNNGGIGISETQTLRVFQSLFISSDLPYSIVKGEIFPVKASVFNYEDTCVPIIIEINPDKRFAITRDQVKQVKKCVCPDDKITHEFYLQPLAFDMENGFRVAIKVSSLSDDKICTESNNTVKKQIKFTDLEAKNVIVEPEGIQKEHVESLFVVFKNNQSISNQTFEIKLPENIVPKSARAYLSTTGDAMGPILNNLENLVQQPTGCGEQNMVKFAPIVSVVNYLKETQQLTSKMSDLTKDYLKIGYQRQLTYRHSDGSFSAFGPSSYKNESGGTWLTAFVLRCFADTYQSKHIKIDEKDILSSFDLLLSRQSEDGSFPQLGAPLFSKALAGGLNEQKIGLSAYVIISLLKSIKAVNVNSSHDQSKIEKGIEFLKSSLDKNIENTDTYSLAIALYAFKLGNTYPKLILEIEKELDNRAIQKNGLTYWTEKKELNNKIKTDFWSSSADLEITSYILLSKLHQLENNQIGTIIQIAKWINSQRNSLGGFHSTQDTVVALDVLSKFASAFYLKTINLKAAYHFNNNNKNSFFINDKNRLLNQKTKLENFKENEMNKIKFDVEGYGTALLQFIVKYNLIKETKNDHQSNFEFSAFPLESKYGSKCDYSKLKISAKYTGKNDKSSMVLVSVRLPSGWSFIDETIDILKETVDLKRYEINENKIFFYFDEINKYGLNFEFDIAKKINVQNRKPGLISVYDYYDSFDDALTYQFELNDKCLDL